MIAGVILCVELFLFTIMKFIMFAESLIYLIPNYLHNTPIFSSCDEWSLFCMIKWDIGTAIIFFFLICLPTIYLKNLKYLSYLSTFGVTAMIIIVVTIFKVFIENIVDNSNNSDETVYITNFNMQLDIH